MPGIRMWTPGRRYTAAIRGASWYTETDDALTVAAVLDGSWGTNRPDLAAGFGPWGREGSQLWIATIPKDAFFVVNDLFDPPIEGPEVQFYRWHSARNELFDKPHRAIGDAVDHGEILSRTAVADIPGVRQLARLGLIRYETRRDARAVRLWQQARLRAEIRHAAARRRWRAYRDAETRRGDAYKGIARKYHARSGRGR